MSESTLILHRGAKIVSREQVAAVPLIESTDTYFPTPHIEVLETAERTLKTAGFEISKSQLALSADGARFFGTLDLQSSIVEGVSLAIGVRNSIDKMFPISLTAGSRVFVCDNLAFSSEIYVAKRHTKFGKLRFDEGIAKSMQSLGQFKQLEAKRIEHYQACEMTDHQAESFLLRAYEAEILTHFTLPTAIKEWRKPSHEEFAKRN